MPQSPSNADASRHPAVPPRAHSHVVGMTGAGLLLGGHYALAGTAFGLAQLAALVLLFTGCAAAVAFCLWERRTFSGTPIAQRRSQSAGRFCAAAWAALTLAALAVTWIGGLAAPASTLVGAGARWPAQGLAIPSLVALFVALPLLTAAWLCLAVMAAPSPAPRTPARPRRGSRAAAPASAPDETDAFDRWLEADVSAERNPASAAPPA